MTLNYDFDEEDQIRWYQYSFNENPKALKARRLHTVKWSALYVCVATAIFLFFGTYTAAVIGYGLAAVLTFATLREYNQRIDAAVKQVVAADPQLKGQLGHCQLTLSDVGMREVTPRTDKTFEWQSVIDAFRDGDYVFVRVATREHAMIPRRSYSGPVPFEEVPQTIHALKQKYLYQRRA
jgi:hypothetical protein